MYIFEFRRFHRVRGYDLYLVKEHKMKSIYCIMSIQLLTRNDLEAALQENVGILFIKFGASWCAPCRQIEPYLEEKKKTLPHNAIYIEIDVDESIDLYAFLKRKKMVQGIPALLCYIKGNTSYVPDEFVSGTNIETLDQFFKTCLESL